MSISLATKGIIAGIGFGSGTGEGGLYPSGYIASTIEIAVDLSEPSITVAADDSLYVAVSLSPVDVDVSLESLDVDVTVDEPSLEVDT